MNFQSVLLFFIDGLSYIELDPFWTYYILYKRARSKEVQEDVYSVVGYATTYEFWKQSVQQCRTRISQFLILPSYQRQGFGTALLGVTHFFRIDCRQYMTISSRTRSATSWRLRTLRTSSRQ